MDKKGKKKMLQNFFFKTSLSEMCHTLCVTSPSGLYFFLTLCTRGKPMELNFQLWQRLSENLLMHEGPSVGLFLASSS